MKIPCITTVVVCVLMGILPLQAQIDPTTFFTPGIKLDTLKYRNGSTYIGGVRDNQLQGKGMLISPFGDTLYLGSFEAGQKEGYGKYFFKNGNLYEGNWHLNHMHGKGTMTFLSGDRYEGDWEQDRRHGEGVYNYKDGSVYSGEFSDGIIHGKGQLVRVDLSYVGEWVNGQKQGAGYQVITGPTHVEEFRGTFDRDQFHGQGYWKHEKDGVITEYEGHWFEGIRVGKGIYTINGRRLEGSWNESEATGTGNCTLETGTYEGSFRRGFFHGEGTFTYIDGGKYEGEWVRGNRQGYGIMTYTDGKIYDGQWYMDQKNGSGTLRTTDGTTTSGTFRDGKKEN